MRAAGIQGRAQVGLLEVHPRRALRLPADPAEGVRRHAGAGQALGPGPVLEGEILRQANVSRMKKETPMEGAGDKLMQELRDVVAAAEEMLAAGADSERVKEIRERLEGAGEQLEARVRKHPYAALGIAAGVGLIIGILLARK